MNILTAMQVEKPVDAALIGNAADKRGDAGFERVLERAIGSGSDDRNASRRESRDVEATRAALEREDTAGEHANEDAERVDNAETAACPRADGGDRRPERARRDDATGKSDAPLQEAAEGAANQAAVAVAETARNVDALDADGEQIIAGEGVDAKSALLRQTQTAAGEGPAGVVDVVAVDGETDLEVPPIRSTVKGEAEAKIQGQTKSGEDVAKAGTLSPAGDEATAAPGTARADAVDTDGDTDLPANARTARGGKLMAADGADESEPAFKDLPEKDNGAGEKYTRAAAPATDESRRQMRKTGGGETRLADADAETTRAGTPAAERVETPAATRDAAAPAVEAARNTTELPEGESIVFETKSEEKQVAEPAPARTESAVQTAARKIAADAAPVKGDVDAAGAPQRDLAPERLPLQTLRIVENMRDGGEQVYKATVRMDPPELGQLRIDVKLENDRLHARFSVESAVARERIQGELPRLREILASQGLEEAQIEVHIEQGGAEQSESDPDARPEETTTGEAAETMETDAAAHRRHYLDGSDGRLDIRA